MLDILAFENALAIIILVYVVTNNRINKSMLSICNLTIVIIIAMAICYYINETNVLISFCLTRYGKALLRMLSQIRLKPSKSMPDITSIDLVIIIKVSYYNLINDFTMPIKSQILQMQNRMLEIYREIVRQIKQIVLKTNNNNYSSLVNA